MKVSEDSFYYLCNTYSGSSQKPPQYAIWVFLVQTAGSKAGLGSSGSLCQPGCSLSPIGMGHGDNQLMELWTAHVIAHEVGHNFGMEHDVDVGCGNWPDVGHMSGNGYGWSSCSKRQVQKIYEKLKPEGGWCLKGKVHVFFCFFCKN